VLMEHLRRPVLRHVKYAAPIMIQKPEPQSTAYLPTMPHTHTLSIEMDTARGMTFSFLRRSAICP
jgi:hypothetical protein